jgi:hypothetical protein
MARLPETTQEWIDRYQKRYDRAYDNYQQSGEQRYDSQAYEYQCIVSAFEALQKREDERDRELERRRVNMNAAVDRLYKNEYTRDEVIKLMNDAVWW